MSALTRTLLARAEAAKKDALYCRQQADSSSSPSTVQDARNRASAYTMLAAELSMLADQWADWRDPNGEAA